MQAIPGSSSSSVSGKDTYWTRPSGFALGGGANFDPFPEYPIGQCRPRVVCYSAQYAGSSNLDDIIGIDCANICGRPDPQTRIFINAPYNGLITVSQACLPYHYAGPVSGRFPMYAWGQVGCLNSQTFDRVAFGLTSHDLINQYQYGNEHTPTPYLQVPCVEYSTAGLVYDPAIYAGYSRNYNLGLFCLDGRFEVDPQGNILAACGCDDIPFPEGTAGGNLGTSGQATGTIELYSNTSITVTTS
jgi:hypothetical protein